jgi:hypothetical protein
MRKYAGQSNQSREDDDTPGTLHKRFGGDSLNHLLEMPDIRRPDVDERIRLAGYRAGVGHFRMTTDGRADLFWRGLPAAEQLHVRLGRPAECGRVDPGGEPGDGTGRAQPVNPPLDGRRGQADLVPDHRVASAGIPNQRGNNPRINLI